MLHSCKGTGKQIFLRNLDPLRHWVKSLLWLKKGYCSQVHYKHNLEVYKYFHQHIIALNCLSLTCLLPPPIFFSFLCSLLPNRFLPNYSHACDTNSFLDNRSSQWEFRRKNTMQKELSIRCYFVNICFKKISTLVAWNC